jgi:hypothetical protein
LHTAPVGFSQRAEIAATEARTRAAEKPGMNAPTGFSKLAGMQAATPIPTPRGLAALPYFLRLVLADLLGNVLEGERAAAHVAQRIAVEDPSAEARQLARVQAHDERLHVDYFERVVAGLGIVRPANPAVRKLMKRARGARTLSQLLIGTNLVIETLGHALFDASSKLAGDLAQASFLSDASRETMTELSAGLEQVQRDESRHLAFGVLRLTELRAEVTAAEQTSFDRAVAEARAGLRRAFWFMPLLVLLRPWLHLNPSSVLSHFDARAEVIGVA